MVALVLQRGCAARSIPCLQVHLGGDQLLENRRVAVLNQARRSEVSEHIVSDGGRVKVEFLEVRAGHTYGRQSQWQDLVPRIWPLPTRR